MAKDPAFLFYPNDFLGGTMGMTLEQKGAYIELLILQFNRGHLTIDVIIRVIGENNWSAIKDKFSQDSNDLFYNERLEMEKIKRKDYCESRRKIRMNRHTNQHTLQRMENENENINDNVIMNVNKEVGHTSKGKSTLKDKQYLMEKRREIFKGNLFSTSNIELYGIPMLNDFFIYWSEANKTKTQMKYEMQETFEVDRRLITWKKNNQKFNKGKDEERPSHVMKGSFFPKKGEPTSLADIINKKAKL